MKAPPPRARTQRCAVYTRKSTEHNLDLAFNSLDAQREACEAYIKSQAHEGWRLVPDHFDDGGLSGASLERDALGRLLDLVRAGRIDVIVVYKVDRLTRSLADFAKLVELFDAHGVSFVSVTQAFNTTSSMGRLTLNVLLSFAQFEREVIGERVRDKIAASKRKGIWVGGPVPLGYRSEQKKLTPVPEEAEIVRTIFRRYLAAGSLSRLALRLAEEGVRPKERPGKPAPKRFGTGALAHLLKNRCYVGEIVYRGEAFRGEHEGIVERALFEAVQERLRAQAVERKSRRSAAQALLTGLLYDDAGHRMTPSHASKRGVRYRYYVSQALLQNRAGAAGSVARVSAPEVEDLVLAIVRRELVARAQTEQAAPSDAGVKASAPTRDVPAILTCIERVTLKRRSVAIVLHCAAMDLLAGAGEVEPSRTDADGDEDANGEDDERPATMVIRAPWTPQTFVARKGLVRSTDNETMDPEARDALLLAIAVARSWVEEMIAGRIRSFDEIAQRERKTERYVRRLAALAWLSPRIVAAIADGAAPSSITLRSLTATLPHDWIEQERAFGFEPRISITHP